MSVEVRMKKESVKELKNRERITSPTYPGFVANELSNAPQTVLPRIVVMTSPDKYDEIKDLGTKESRNMNESDVDTADVSKEDLGVASVGSNKSQGDKSELATFRRSVNESLKEKSNNVNVGIYTDRPDLETFTSLFKKHLLTKSKDKYESVVTSMPDECDVQRDLETSSELLLPSIDLTIDDPSGSSRSKKDYSPINTSKKSARWPRHFMKKGPRKIFAPRITRPVHGFPSPHPRAFSTLSKSHALHETSIAVSKFSSPYKSEKNSSHCPSLSDQKNANIVVRKRFSDWNLPPGITVSRIPKEDTKLSLKVLAEVLNDISDKTGPTRKVQINATDAQLKGLSLLGISAEVVFS